MKTLLESLTSLEAYIKSNNKIKKVSSREYTVGSFYISNKGGTDWVVGGEVNGEFFRSTVESFRAAKEEALKANAEQLTAKWNKENT